VEQLRLQNEQLRLYDDAILLQDEQVATQDELEAAMDRVIDKLNRTLRTQKQRVKEQEIAKGLCPCYSSSIYAYILQITVANVNHSK
jgi:hypothetical protein